MEYLFAVNKLKLQRAIAELTEEAKEKGTKDFKLTEDAVKARYVKLLGLLAEEEEAKTAAPRAAMKAPAYKASKKN